MISLYWNWKILYLCDYNKKLPQSQKSKYMTLDRYLLLKLIPRFLAHTFYWWKIEELLPSKTHSICKTFGICLLCRFMIGSNHSLKQAIIFWDNWCQQLSHQLQLFLKKKKNVCHFSSCVDNSMLYMCLIKHLTMLLRTSGSNWLWTIRIPAVSYTNNWSSLLNWTRREPLSGVFSINKSCKRFKISSRKDCRCALDNDKNVLLQTQICLNQNVKSKWLLPFVYLNSLHFDLFTHQLMR